MNYIHLACYSLLRFVIRPILVGLVLFEQVDAPQVDTKRRQHHAFRTMNHVACVCTGIARAACVSVASFLSSVAKAQEETGTKAT